MVHLIDSIFRNFYIPPIIFTVTKDESEEIRTCVDGKQRLTSIQKFFDGQVGDRLSFSKHVSVIDNYRRSLVCSSSYDIPNQTLKNKNEQTGIPELKSHTGMCAPNPRRPLG